MTLPREESSTLQRWLVFAIAGSGIFLATSGISVVNVALPFITQDFQADITTAQWVLLAYLLTTSTLLINFGRLGDLLGSYRVHNAGLFIFTLASFLCSLSTSTGMLLAFRTLQAVGGAMVIANGPATVTSIFPANQRGRVLGLQVTLLGIALSAGPTIGGLLIGAFGWRSVFLYNVPFGLGGLLLTRFAKVPSQEPKRVQVDLAGSILLFLSIASFVLATNRARDLSWSAPSVLFLLSVFLFSGAAFLITERFSSKPMLDLRLFRNRVFALAQAGNFIAHLSTFGVIFLMPFYLIRVLRVSAEASGLILLPLTVMMIVLGPVSGFLSDRFGTKWPSVSGMALLCLGLYSLTSLDESSSIAGVVLRLALLGGGRAVYGSPNQSATMGAVQRERLGVAGGIFATMRHLGNISGLALTGSYFSARLAFHLQRQNETASGQTFTESSFIAAFHETFYFSLWVSLAGLLATLFQKEINDPRGRRG